MKLGLELWGACGKGGVDECDRNKAGVMGRSIESHFQKNAFDRVIPMMG